MNYKNNIQKVYNLEPINSNEDLSNYDNIPVAQALNECDVTYLKDTKEKMKRKKRKIFRFRKKPKVGGFKPVYTKKDKTEIGDVIFIVAVIAFMGFFIIIAIL